MQLGDCKHNFLDIEHLQFTSDFLNPCIVVIVCNGWGKAGRFLKINKLNDAVNFLVSLQNYEVQN